MNSRKFEVRMMGEGEEEGEDQACPRSYHANRGSSADSQLE